MDFSLPCYDRTKTYQWNYDHAPTLGPRAIDEIEIAPVAGQWDFCGLQVDSPLGVSAGPLLNGQWCLYYAALGFDVLTYKTVRSSRRECYPLPNLQPVRCGQLSGSDGRLEPTEPMDGSWAVSFGMPSSEPETWRRDIERTREQLPAGKILSVSVVGTMQQDWTMAQLADDYAKCAAWAVESGADCIETNFSCPNVSTCDGQLYQDCDQSRRVVQTVRDAIGDVPLILKIGHVRTSEDARSLLHAISGHANALAMTNSIATTVGRNDNDLLFQGQKRGICGEATREASIEQVHLFADAVVDTGINIKLIGVGGISKAAHVRRFIEAGAHACHLATAVMTDPMAGVNIRYQLSRGRS
jgi:dihydroorotate dehydrogenase